MDDRIDALNGTPYEVEVAEISDNRFVEIRYLNDVTTTNPVPLTLKSLGDESPDLAGRTGHKHVHGIAPLRLA